MTKLVAALLALALSASVFAASSAPQERAFGPFVVSCASDAKVEQVDCTVISSGEIVFTTTLLPLSPSTPVDIAVHGSTMNGTLSAAWDSETHAKTIHADLSFVSPRNGNNKYTGVLFSFPIVSTIPGPSRNFGPFTFNCSSDEKSEAVECRIYDSTVLSFDEVLQPASPSSPINITMDSSNMTGTVSVSWDVAGKAKVVSANITFTADGLGANRYEGVLFTLPLSASSQQLRK